MMTDSLDSDVPQVEEVTAEDMAAVPVVVAAVSTYS